MLTAGQAAMDAAMKQAATDAPEMAGVIGMVAQATLVFSAFWVLVQLVLGFVQWVRPNVVIPIIFAILAGLGLLWGLCSLLIAGSADVAAAVPGWQAVKLRLKPPRIWRRIRSASLPPVLALPRFAGRTSPKAWGENLLHS